MALGRRGIFLTKFRDQLPSSLPASMLHREFAPFQKLFPHCAAVVHHGGVGTVAKALAAGIPQLIRPICFDQEDNGHRVKRLGVGDWLKFGPGGGRLIAEALRRLITPETQQQCRVVAARFENQDGLAAAARCIEWFMEAGGSSNSV